MNNNIKIVNKKIDDLIPYEKNPRKNEKAVQYVANSIKQFGFKIPCVIDKNNVIITGHTRVLACKELGITEIPCVLADDLTQEQAKAFRIADNRVSEFATWDFDLLDEELKEIQSMGIDMADFDFEVNVDDLIPDETFDIPQSVTEENEQDSDETDEEFVQRYTNKYGEENVKVNYDEKGNVSSVEIPNARMKTIENYNLHLIEHHTDEKGAFINDLSHTAGFFQFPRIKKTDFVPTDLIGFNYVGSSKNKEAGIHFYLDDYQFERIWTCPEVYVSELKQFQCVISPDFSLYYTMPNAMKIWNLYRNRVIAHYLQSKGITVIPTVSCCVDDDILKFAFDGIEAGGTICVSSMSVKKDKKLKEVWKHGVTVMIEKLKPSTLIVYGGEVEDFELLKSQNVIYFDNTNFKYSRKESD